MKPQADSQGVGLGDERRDLVRIDDKLLLEVGLAGEPPETPSCGSDETTEAAIAALISRPTQELLASQQDSEMGAFLGPWLMKLDWTLALMLKTLAKMSPEPVAMPRVVEVNISGGGLSFKSSRLFQQGDLLDVRLILPPFVPILAKAEVIRVPLSSQGAACHTVAARFVSIKPEDRERLIRHIFQVQAERLRTRFLSSE